MSLWRHPLRWPLLLVMLTAVGGWLISSERALASEFMVRLALGLLVFHLMLGLVTDTARLRLALWMCTLILAGLAAVALFGTRWPAAKILPLDAIYRRLPTLLVDTLHPNVAAATLVLLLPIPGVLWVDGRQTWSRWFCLVIMGLTLAILVLTQSRAAWLALAGMALAVVWRQAQGPWLRWLLILLIASAAGLLLWLARHALAADWLGRQMVWAQALTMLQDFGMTGIGPGSFGVLGPQLYADFWMGDLTFVAPHAHNLFLQVGVDLGVMGLVGYLALLLTAAASAWSVWRRGPTRLARTTAGALLLSLLALVLEGTLDIGAWGTQGGFVAWLILGLATALRVNLD